MEYQNHDLRDNVKETSNENNHVVVETSGIGDERIPNSLSWGTGKSCEGFADNIAISSDHGVNPGTVEYEGVEAFLGCK